MPEEKGAAARIHTGIVSLDEALSGGLTEGSQTLLIGETGTAKTLLSLNASYANASSGIPVVYLSIDESKDLLIRNMTSAFPGLPDSDAIVQSNRLFILERNIIMAIKSSDVIERFLVILENAIAANSAKLMVIDSLGMIRANLNDDRAFTKAVALITEYLRQKNVASIIISEAVSHAETKVPGLFDEAMFDNIIRVRKYDGHGGRNGYTLAIAKLRFSQYKNVELQFEITPRGIVATPVQQRGQPANRNASKTQY